MLKGEKAIRREQQQDVPDSDGSKPFAFSIGGRDLQASNRKGADWKQILNKAKDLTGDLTQQFAAFKEWLESDWRGNAKRAAPTADPTAAAAAEHAPVRNKPALGQPPAKKLRQGTAPSACVQLQPGATAPVAAPSAPDATPPSALPPDTLDALARLVATRLHDARALQNGGVGDQLGDRLQRIENSQGRLVELAVAEYIRQNEDSVRAAAVKKYSKANRHDQAFVAEAKRAYAERHHSSIVAAAAAKYMEAHEDDEDFREEAIDAYVVKHQDSEELKDAAAEKYKDEHEDDDEFVAAAQDKYIEENEDDIHDAAVEKYKDDHEDDDDFVEAAREEYIKKHEDDIQECAAEKYKEEHAEDADFKRAAVRMLADES